MLDLLCAPYAATISTSSNLSNPDNLLSDRLGRAAKTLSAGGVSPQFMLDLGSAKAVDTLALLATDFAATDSLQWFASTVGNPAGPFIWQQILDPALASPSSARVHRQSLLKLSTPVTARYFYVQLYGAGAASPMVAGRSIGRAFVGKAFEPLEGRDYGWEQRVVDLGENQRTQTGLDDPVIRGKVQEWTWTWSGLTQDEAENQALDLMTYAGTTRDLLWCGDYTASNVHNKLGYGKMTEPAVRRNYAEGWYELQCQMLSRLILGL